MCALFGLSHPIAKKKSLIQDTIYASILQHAVFTYQVTRAWDLPATKHYQLLNKISAAAQVEKKN